MSTVTTATSSIAVEARDHYNKVLLHRATEILEHGKRGKKASIPRGEGKKIKWRRFSNLAAATTPLVEGVTPTAGGLIVVEVEKTVQQFGNWVPFSDRVSVESIDPILEENAEILGYNSGHTLDLIARAALVAGTNVFYTGGQSARANVGAAHVINDAEIRKIKRQMERNLVPKFGGANGYYVAIVHPDVYMDLQATTAFTNTGYYQNKRQLETGEVMNLYGIMWVPTTLALKYAGAGASSIDVYATLVFGPESYGVVDIEGLGLQNIYKGLGSAGAADPLNQRQTQGWKGTYEAKILNENYVLRVESAATA